MSKKTIPNRVYKQLYGLSAGRCNICNQKIVDNDLQIGNIAHIVGELPGSARHDPNYVGDLNAIENLILLCPNHHAEVDDKDRCQHYTVKYLLDIKARHEDKNREELINSNDNEFVQVLKKEGKLYELQNYIYNLPQGLHIRFFDLADTHNAIMDKYIQMYIFLSDRFKKEYDKFYESYIELVNIIQFHPEKHLIFYGSSAHNMNDIVFDGHNNLSSIEIKNYFNMIIERKEIFIKNYCSFLINIQSYNIN